MTQELAFVYVEDDQFSQEIMRLIMTRRLGYQNFTVLPDSTDFIEKLDALPLKPKVIFLDIHIQPINGFEMLKLLRSHPTYRDTIIVALTASVMNEEVDLLKTAGFDGGIAKPLDQAVFPEVLERILQKEEVWHIA